MKEVYETLLEEMKQSDELPDYELLLYLLLYQNRKNIVISDYYHPRIYYENMELICQCIDQLIKDAEITKEELLKPFFHDGEDDEDTIWRAFPNIINFIVALEEYSDDQTFFQEAPYCDKMQTYYKKEKRI